MEVTTATQRRVRVTAHAVQRYRERVKPALDIPTCDEELRALVAAGRFQAEEPFPRHGDDIDEADRPPEPDGYIELAPKIFAVVEIERGLHIALTILIDGIVSEPRRERRNLARAASRQRKQRKRRESFYRQGSRRSREERWR